jgi:hypothetical protein
LRRAGSFPGWTNPKRQLDDSGRGAPDQAAAGPGCNGAAGRACVVAVAIALSAGLHTGTGQAAGEPAPADLSTQIQALVSSALETATAQPVSDDAATKTANNIAADVESTASQVATPETTALESETTGTSPPSENDVPVRAGPVKIRPHALHRARTAANTGTRGAAIVSENGGWSAGSHLADEPPLAARAQTDKAAPRHQRSAPPDRPPAPVPVPPRPDSSSAGQSGGQGTPGPSVIAGLSALLFVFGFQFLPRLLPLLAFRKPRRIVLPAWHPG